MARRNRPALAPTQSQPPLVQRSGQQPQAPPSGETFDIENISGDEDKDEDYKLGRSSVGTQAATSTVVEQNIAINNPDIVAPRSRAAGDIHYFFEKTVDKWRCKFCK
jgi:hypothetical protein